MRLLAIRSAVLIACLTASNTEPLTAVEPASLTLTSPKPHQVIQRTGFDPYTAALQRPGHPAFGFADVTVRAAPAIVPERAAWEYRVVLLSEATGGEVAWTNIDVRAEKLGGIAMARVPAGGWYRLELRCRNGDTVTHVGAVEPIGIGEVFIVAGQSYATNCNDERFKVLDPAGRVAVFDAPKDRWGVAHDPQPTPDGSDGGSIWPPLGDALAAAYRVPIGFANVAVAATSSVQWLPDGPLHTRLVKVGRALGRFRAVLWQQGESDVIAKSPTATYVANVTRIRTVAADAWGFEPPWLLAKSTLHPTVYNDPQGEGRIRSGIDELVKRPGFHAGPDTDTLGGENRGDAKSRRHFSAIGQRRAAALWLAVLKRELDVPRPVRERLEELKLLEPAWASPVVYRESSVLMLTKPDSPPTTRLAFPAAEVLEVATADGRHRFDIGDVTLSKDGLLLTVAKPSPVEPIKAADLFPPKDSPNSYRHRTGHPDQNLLYRPGRWFHDHNIEVTYRRRETPVAEKHGAALPKTLARLAAGKPLTLGISGDSISTGADASAVSKAVPFQPGYADLVVAQFEVTYRGTVTLKNRAVGGWSVANGVADIDKLLAEKPHLIVVAYGMNDVGRRDPKWFGKQTRAILDRIRAADSETEVILVSSMLGHAEWVHTPREMFAAYRDELRALTGPGVALADVTAVWEVLLKNKHDLDLTGNGMNHPNDFGHRLYAQAILQALVSGK